RGLSVEPSDTTRRDDADASMDDSEVAYIARSKRDVAEHFGVAWSTMQPRLVGKVGGKPASPARATNLPDEVESELFQHVVWLCENGHPMNWDNIKAIAWKLGKMAGIEDFAATNHWLKRFKARFPTLEARYSHHLRTTQLGKADMAYAERGRDERNHSDATSLGDGGSSAGEGCGGGGSYVVPTDLKVTTAAGGYLALQRAKVEAEASVVRRNQQQQAGIALNTAGAATPAGTAAGAATSTSAAHQEAQLRLAHGSIVGGLPGNVLGAHPYNSSQLQMGQSPHGPHSLLDSTVRGGVWGQAGTGTLVGSPSTHGEIPPTATPPPNFQLQQQYQHLHLGLHQAGQMGIGGQRMVPIPGQQQQQELRQEQQQQEQEQEQQQEQQQQQQHLVSGGGVPGVPSGQIDASRMHAVRSQGPTPLQLAGLAGQNMGMGLGGGAHPQQVAMAIDARGGAMTPIYPPAGVGGAGTQAMGMVGQWQAAVGWPEQLMGPWQHVAISQVQGMPQQQLLHPIATPPSSYESQGMLNPGGTGLALLQQQRQQLLRQQYQHHQQARQQQQQQQQQHQGPAPSAWLNTPVGHGYGQHQQPAMLASVARGHAGGDGGGGGGGPESLLDMRQHSAAASAGSAEQDSAQHQEQPPK
ncbi:unnamed protein product, partial [Ectocarpus fasciculatus]